MAFIRIRIVLEYFPNNILNDTKVKFYQQLNVMYYTFLMLYAGYGTMDVWPKYLNIIHVIITQF